MSVDAKSDAEADGQEFNFLDRKIVVVDGQVPTGTEVVVIVPGVDSDGEVRVTDGEDVYFILASSLADPPAVNDPVNHPTHYQRGGLEAFDVLNAFFTDDPLGWQVGKYILRYRGKNGLEDLRKARWYLDKMIERETN